MTAYRIAGLPAEVTRSTARAILDGFFGEDTQTVVRSIGLHPQTSALVAIVMFFPIPEELAKDDPAGWTLEKLIQYDDHEAQDIRLEIDTAFLGFTPLNIAKDSGAGTVDCIVVSGLSSHPFGSWKQRGGQFMWLVDDKGANPTNVRVLLWGYDSSLVASESFQDVTDIGERLAVSIKSIRSSSAHTPMVFIAHSLGGLVVKEAICRMAKDDVDDSKCVYGLVFFGVPHGGLLVEPWLKIVDQRPNKILIQNLEQGSRYTERLDRNFREAFVAEGSKVITIFETMTSATTNQDEAGNVRRSGPNEVLVTPSSALGHWSDLVSHRQIAMNQAHENLPKFKGRFDENYLVLKPYLHELYSTAITDVGKRFETSSQGASAPNKPTFGRFSKPTVTVEDEDEDDEEPMLGLTGLWPSLEVEATTKVKTEVDLIAIHGLGGHALSSWIEGDKLWLRDFIPWELQKLRVLTFGYDTSLLFTTDKTGIRDTANQLLQGIRQFRRTRSETLSRKTIFVCHGFGGIILKQAYLMSLETGNRYHDIGSAFAGVIFLGTPQIKQDLVAWTNLLSKVAQLHSLEETLLANVERNAMELGETCDAFFQKVQQGLGLQIFSFYERHVSSKLGTLVVAEAFAKLHLPNETPLPLDADHQGLGRYLTSSSMNYRTVYDCIADVFDNLSGTPQQGIHNSWQREFISDLRAINSVRVLDLVPLPSNKSTDWFHGHEDLVSWSQPQGRQVIWLHGEPGSGKSVLMRSVVSHLISGSECTDDSLIRKPLYFFFDDKDMDRRSTLACVRSLLSQILSDERTSFVIKYLEGRDRKADSYSEEKLWICLRTIIERSRGIMFQLVIDAVDEVLRSTTSTSITILDRLQRILSIDNSGRFRVIISSRATPPSDFMEFNVAVIAADNPDTEENVKVFIRARISKLLSMSFMSQATGQAVEEKIITIAGGNFLHATLAWEQFTMGVTAWSRSQIDASLNRLNKVSSDFVASYCRLLEGIPKIHRAKARASFAILRVAQQSLTAVQLAFFATLYAEMQDSDGKFSQAHILKSMSYDFEIFLSEACGYIIRTAEDGTVGFRHVSAKDLFAENFDELSPSDKATLSEFTLSETSAHSMVHDLCMAIFSLENRSSDEWHKYKQYVTNAKDQLKATFGNRFLTRHQATQIREKNLEAIAARASTPCFPYAILHVMEHHRIGESTYERDEMLVGFLASIPGVYCHQFWHQIQGEDDDDERLRPYGETHLASNASETNALFRALARTDSPRVIKLLIANGANVNYMESMTDSVTPLSLSIICQRKESFRVLLRNESIAINYGAPNGSKPLHFAARNSDVFFIETLAKIPGINVNLMSTTGTPLHNSMTLHNVPNTEVLLDHPDIDLGIKDKDKNSPYALAFKHEIWGTVLPRMIKMIAEKPSIRDATFSQKVSGTSQLLLAGVHGWTHIELAIIETDPRQVLVADPDTKMNALQFYAFFGREAKLVWMLDQLPRRDFPPLRSDTDVYDLLQLCANQNWEDVVHKLQKEWGMKPLASDHVSRTLLHWAVENNWDFAKISLDDYTVDNINKQDRDGLTALHLAITHRNMFAAEALMAAGANCMLKDKGGMSAIHMAADQGFRAGLDLFIERTSFREFGRTRNRASLLHLLALWFDGPLVERFVKNKRALVHVVDEYRRTPLHYAAMVNNVSTVEMLVSLGARIDFRDANGKSPLHEAIRGGGSEAAIALLRLGANHRAVDAFDQTCLHLALRYGRDELVSRFMTDRNLSLEDKFGMTPLHRACYTGNVDHINRLLRRGVEWSPFNNYTRTPIDLAVEAQQPAAVRAMTDWLKTQGVDENMMQHRLYSALRLAVEYDIGNIEEIFVEAGVRIDRSVVRVRRLYGTDPEKEPKWNHKWKMVTFDSHKKSRPTFGKKKGVKDFFGPKSERMDEPPSPRGDDPAPRPTGYQPPTATDDSEVSDDNPYATANSPSSPQPGEAEADFQPPHEDRPRTQYHYRSHEQHRSERSPQPPPAKPAQERSRQQRGREESDQYRRRRDPSHERSPTPPPPPPPRPRADDPRYSPQPGQSDDPYNYQRYPGHGYYESQPRPPQPPPAASPGTRYDPDELHFARNSSPPFYDPSHIPQQPHSLQPDQNGFYAYRPRPSPVPPSGGRGGAQQYPPPPPPPPDEIDAAEIAALVSATDYMGSFPPPPPQYQGSVGYPGQPQPPPQPYQPQHPGYMPQPGVFYQSPPSNPPRQRWRDRWM